MIILHVNDITPTHYVSWMCEKFAKIKQFINIIFIFTVIILWNDVKKTFHLSLIPKLKI